MKSPIRRKRFAIFLVGALGVQCSSSESKVVSDRNSSGGTGLGIGGALAVGGASTSVGASTGGSLPTGGSQATGASGAVSDSGIEVDSGINSIVANTPEAPPATVAMTPPVAADANATEQLKLLMRGMNVGNFLDATPTEASWTGDTLHGWYFEAIKEAGFDHVRIPVRWNAHATALAPDYTIEPVFFARVDWAIAHTLTRGMAVVLTLQHFDEYYADPAGRRDQFLALWQQIATHYKNYPKALIFEILDEPQNKITQDIWNADMNAAVAQIRSSNPYRTLIVGGINYSNVAELYNNHVAFPAGDKNIIATFHYYEPYCFTIPPQTWDCNQWDAPFVHSGAFDFQNVKWPVLFPTDATSDAGTDSMAANNKAKIDNTFNQVSTWSKSAGIPVYLGEFGADTSRDVQSRASYLGYIVDESVKFGFGWANWSFIYTFAAWNGTAGWYPEIISALTGQVTN